MIAPALPEQTNDQHSIYNGDLGVDLALDQQGHPRIAYRLGYGVDELGYTWCDANSASWRYLVMPTTAATEQELGLPPREGCPDCVPPIPPAPALFTMPVTGLR